LDKSFQHLLSTWRLQISTLRIVNIWLVFSGFLTTFLLFHDFLPAVYHLRNSKTHDTAWIVGMAAAGMMVLVLGSFLCYLILRYVRRGRSSLAVPELQAVMEHAVNDVRKKLRLHRQQTIEVHVRNRPDGPPASILQQRRKLVVIFRPDFAVVTATRPRIARAFFAHELTHPLQWDTRFGKFWFQSDRLLAIAVGFLALVAMFDLLRQTTVEALHHHYAAAWSTLHYVAMEGMAFVASVWSTLWFFIVRRWAEYSADLSAVLAGYTDEMVDLLGRESLSKRSLWSWFWLLSGPSNSSRLKRIENYHQRYPSLRTLTEGLDPEHSVVRSEPKLREYVAALIFRVIPFFAAFMFIGVLFVVLEVWIADLPNPLNY